uniref:Uncharacterized protein n=1 Tax=uncultured prokaryote TaxID=198431 RepID=A0A0H5Q8T5_9ZZZZ|nr:hypothetical protein [uncultured prokaryote]
MIPYLQPQATLVPPVGLHLEHSLLWTPKADHSIVRKTLRSGKDGELIAMGVGSAPDWRDFNDLARALAETLWHDIRICHSTYVAPEPF